MKVFSPKFGIFGQTFSDEKIFDNYSAVKNLGLATAPITVTCHSATTPQPVHRIESKFFSNRIESDLSSAESPTSSDRR